MMTILATDVHTRKGFDVYNIISHFFPDLPLVITADKKKNFFFRQSFNHPIYLLRTTTYEDFEADLNQLLNRKDFAKPFIYLPVEEKTTLHYYQFVKENKQREIIAMLPDEATFHLSRNKYKLARFCESNAIPHPSLIDRAIIESWTEKDFRRMVYKPAIGTGSKGVTYVRTIDDLRQVKIKQEYFFQEMVSGSRDVVGVFVLMRNGKAVASYAHKRLRTYPENGGVTVFSKYLNDQVAIDLGEKILTALNWEGLAMVEFLYDANDKQYKLIEINPRLWGSVLLSEFSGAALIQQYVCLLCGMQYNSKPIKKESYIRWVFPYDFILLLKGKEKIKDFWRRDGGNTCYIGFTYSSWKRSLLFILSSYFDKRKILSLLSKK